MRVMPLKHGKCEGTECEVNVFGATVTSWKVDGVENLFLSEKAVLDGSKAIRGGIPICFPSFGPWEHGPAHGFARTSDDWRVLMPPRTDPETGDVSVILVLSDDPSTWALWEHSFRFMYTVKLRADSLQLSVRIDSRNSGDRKFDFTFALHTYFKVDDIATASVRGLKGLTYADKADSFKEKLEEADEVKVAEFVDRVYQKAPDEGVVVTGLAGGREVMLEKTGMDDIEVWNPWLENAQKMSDLGDDEYKKMLCVEPVQKTTKVTLGSTEMYMASHTITVVKK